MKILYVMPQHISFGGIESVALNLWNGMRKRGHQVDFVCHGYQKGIREDEIISAGSNVFHISVKSKNYLLMRRQFEKILENEYDVVHAHMNATSGIYLQMAKKKGVKVLVAHSHASSMSVITKNPLKVIINSLEKKRTQKNANVRIACSEAAGNWLYGKKTFQIIYNGVDINKFKYDKMTRNTVRSELGISDSSLVIIHIGSFIKCKNHKFLLKVFSKLLKKNKDAVLLLIGDGELKESIENDIKILDLKKNVIELGHRDDVNKLLQAADVFWLPSLSEGNPVSMLEALVSGTFCIVSNQVPSDLSSEFDESHLIFLPITGDVSKAWVKNTLLNIPKQEYKYERIYSYSADCMVEKVEKIYKKVGNIIER